MIREMPFFKGRMGHREVNLKWLKLKKKRKEKVPNPGFSVRNVNY